MFQIKTFAICMILLTVVACESGSPEIRLETTDWIGKPFVEFVEEFGEAKDIGSGVYVYQYKIGNKTYLVSVSGDEISNIKEL